MSKAMKKAEPFQMVGFALGALLGFLIGYGLLWSGWLGFGVGAVALFFLPIFGARAKALSAREINDELDTNWFFRQTRFSISDEEAKEIEKLFMKKSR